MTLNDPWFHLVRSGRKRFEGRRLTCKVQAIRIGDAIEFSHHTDKASHPIFRLLKKRSRSWAWMTCSQG